MIINTKVYELCDGKYKNLSELAQAMGISVSQIYRVREGKRHINQKFITVTCPPKIGPLEMRDSCKITTGGSKSENKKVFGGTDIPDSQRS